jgi:uncharacterized membrane protein YgdD (TMEM256/DUF423 family)
MTTPRRILLALAGLMGAAGVALAAAGAHLGGDNLATAATFLLIHAAAVAGLASGAPNLRGLTLAASLLALGALLFSGDIAARAFLGGKLFPMAAPAGGIILMAGWLALAVAAALGSGARKKGERNDLDSG